MIIFPSTTRFLEKGFMLVCVVTAFLVSL
jgi:hypothetical protein